MGSIIYTTGRRLACVVSAILVMAAPRLAYSGVISGVIKAKETGAALMGAHVTIVGTNLGAATDANGHYTIENVPAGSYKLRASFIGFQHLIVEVQVGSDGMVTVDFSLSESALIGETLVISASRRTEKLTDAPATINVISARAIDEYPAFNAGELVARQKGVDYVRSGVVGVGLNIRGFNSAFNSKNLQMNDARLATLIATGLPLGALSTTVKEDIERMEVILGPAAALYGPNAHNGLVNTITKDPRTSPGTTVAFGGGNQSVASARFRHANVVNQKLAYKISGEYSRGEEFSYVDTVYNSAGTIAWEELELDRDFDSMRGEAAVYYSLKPETALIIAGGGSNSNNLGVTSVGRNQVVDSKVIFLQARFASPRWFAQLYHTWSNTEDTYAINQRTQNYWSFRNAGFSDEEARRRSLHEAWSGASPTVGRALNREANFKENSRRLNAELQYDNAWAGFNIVAGAQWQRDMADSKHTFLLDQEGVINLDQYGFYGQIERPFGQTGFKAMIAARADDHELYGFNFIPKGGLLYSNTRGTWRLTYGKGIAAPTILNLSAKSFGGLLLGNGEGFTLADGTKIPALAVEKIQTFELGYKGIIGEKLYLDANAYYNMSKDFLSPALDIAKFPNGPAVTHRGSQPIAELGGGLVRPGDFVITYLNFGEVNTYGVDLGLNYYFNDEINLAVSYSFFDFDLDKSDARNDGNRNGKVEDTDLPINTPKNKAIAGLSLSKPKYFGSVFGRWVQAYDFFSGINVAAKTNTSLIVGGDPVVENTRVGRDFNEGPLGDFLTVDLSAGYRLSSRVSVAGHVTNLFDSKVREFVASPPIGRLVATEVKFTF